MTTEEVRRHQRAFEVAGSVVCGLLFGGLLWFVETESGPPSASEGLSHLAWNLMLATACYLGAYYYLDGRAARHRWDGRPNWVLIALSGTTLLCFARITPFLFDEGGYRVRRLDEKAVSFCFVLLLMNVVGVAVMGAVWLVGYADRLRRRRFAGKTVAP